MLLIEEIKEYAFERIGSSILSDENKQNIERMLRVFAENRISTNEMWFEVHFSQETDVIFKVWDFRMLYKMAERLVVADNLETADTWRKILVLCEKKCTGNNVYYKYIVSISLEYDMKALCEIYANPCFFFELDYELLEKDKVNRKEFEKFINREILTQIQNDPNKIINTRLQEGLAANQIHIWNLGYMSPRKDDLRIVFQPMNIDKMEKLLDIIDQKRSMAKIQEYLELADNVEDVEFILDCDFNGEMYNNVGINIFYKKYHCREKLLYKLQVMGAAGEQEVADILKWPKKKVLNREKGNIKILMWELCHLKIKLSENVNPKIYLRTEVITN